MVGHSDLTDDATFHAYRWTRETGMRDIGTLPGDFASLAIGINDRSDIVGASLAADFSPRAVIWRNDAITDLNALIPAFRAASADRGVNGFDRGNRRPGRHKHRRSSWLSRGPERPRKTVKAWRLRHKS